MGSSAGASAWSFAVMSPPQLPPKPMKPASAFASLALFGATIASGVAIAVIAPKYFTPKPQPGSLNDNTPKYILAAFPFFILLLVVEYVVGRGSFKIAGRYRLTDSVTSMTAGLFQTLLQVLIPIPQLISLIPYAYIRTNYPDYVLSIDGVWGNVLAMLMADFTYYWFHRAAHEVNILWGVHVTHHSSESYNFSTALRQGALQSFASEILYVPMALLFPLPVFTFHKAWNTLYQFWVHTTIIRRLGVLEYILVTPSHHRVHHDRRVHKNYGGIFIIWDRLFGSFVDEGEDNDPRQCPVPDGDERVVYGVLTGINSWDVITVQFHHLWDVLHRAWLAEGFARKVKIVWSGPGMRPQMTRTHLPDMNPNVIRLRYQARHSFATGAYILVHFLLAVANSALHMVALDAGEISYAQFAGLVAGTLWMFHCHGRLMNGGSPAVRYAEIMRVATMATAGAYLLHSHGVEVRTILGGALWYSIAATTALHILSAVAVAIHPALLHVTSYVTSHASKAE